MNSPMVRAYRIIEDFWGVPFDNRLIREIRDASGDKLAEFAELWPVVEEDPPPLPRGVLRPMIYEPAVFTSPPQSSRGSADRELKIALHSLLYAPEVLMDWSHADLFGGIQPALFSRSGKNLADRVSEAERAAVEFRLQLQGAEFAELRADIAQLGRLRSDLRRAENDMTTAYSETSRRRRVEAVEKLKRELSLAEQAAARHPEMLIARRNSLVADFERERNKGDRLATEAPMRKVIEERLVRLQIIRPFVEEGSIQFGRVRRAHLESYGFAYELAFLVSSQLSLEDQQRVRDLVPGGIFATDSSLESHLARVTVQMGRLLDVARTRVATPIARSEVESLIWSNLVGSIGDRRRRTLEVLARVGVPRFRSDPVALARLRRESDAFAEWRLRLGEAIRDIEDLSADRSADGDAKEIVFGALHESLQTFPREERRSAALKSLRVGTSVFAVTGLIGGSVQAVVGQPAVTAFGTAALGAAAGGAAEVLIAYQESRRETRRGQLIWDVFLGMQDRDDDDIDLPSIDG